jgi:hydrogenase maturation protease
VAERLVLGIGNPDRGDDAVGRLIARCLRTRVPADVRIAEHDGEATALLAELQSARRAWLIDAARSGARPGTIRRIDSSVADLAIPSGTVSSHGSGVAEAIALARALNVLPGQCIVYAVEGANFAAGAPLSAEVTEAMSSVVEQILAELQEPAPRPSPVMRGRVGAEVILPPPSCRCRQRPEPVRDRQ